MDAAFEDKIRLRAYEVWQAAGMSEGEAERHWLQAERVVHEEAVSGTALVSTVRKAAVKTVSKTTATKVAGSHAVKAKSARTMAPRRSKVAAAAEAVA